jgi:hypothetical protein
MTFEKEKSLGTKISAKELNDYLTLLQTQSKVDCSGRNCWKTMNQYIVIRSKTGKDGGNGLVGFSCSTAFTTWVTLDIK